MSLEIANRGAEGGHDLDTSSGVKREDFKILFDGPCGGNGDCPTIYQTPSGSIAIQGYRPTADERAALNIPEGEDVVILPPEFFQRALNQLSS